MPVEIIHTIPITAKPAPRPRFSKWGAYNTADYTKHKQSLELLLNSLHIPKHDWCKLSVLCAFPYSKSEPKKNRIDSQPHRNKFDCDNLIKPLCDAMQNIGVLINDSQLSEMAIKKIYTTKAEGYITFRLTAV